MPHDDFFEKTEHYGKDKHEKDGCDGPGQNFLGKVDYIEEEADEDRNQILGAADEFMEYDEDGD